MAQFRTTADIIDAALRNAGEVTNGNSGYEAHALTFVNRVHFSLIAGGTIPLGKDVSVTIDETWPWAKSERPLVLELQPKFDSGSLTLTLGSEAGTLSAPPAYSLAGWFVRLEGQDGLYRIATHTASGAGVELDGAFPLASGSYTFTAMKLDYELTPSYLVIDSMNNKVDFKTTSGGGQLTATLTSGVYTPSDLATHVAAQMTTAAAGPTITGSFSSLNRTFSVVSDGTGSTTILPLFATGTNIKQSAHRLLGFDDLDPAAALTHTSSYILGGLSRITSPMRVASGAKRLIFGADHEAFDRYEGWEPDEGIPDTFSIIRESADGVFTVRFNRYPKEKTRIEVECVLIPRDLKDNAASIPLIPRKYVELLEDAATFRIMMLKSDSRASAYMTLVHGTLTAMIAQHRGSLAKTGERFGEIISRADNMSYRRRGLFGEPYE